MHEEYLFDVDKVQDLLVAYGQTDSTERMNRIEERVLEETIGAVYPEEYFFDYDFPTGTPLLAAILQLHRRTDNDSIADLVEEEVDRLLADPAMYPIATFESTPVPYATSDDLMEYYEYFVDQDPAIARYFRFRVFQEVGAFDDKGLLRVRDSEGGLYQGLTENELEYLNSL